MLKEIIRYLVIPTIISVITTQAISYFFGLYCSLQLNFYYWKELNLHIESRRKVSRRFRANSIWRQRFEVEKEFFSNSIRKSQPESTMESSVNRKRGPRAVRDEFPDQKVRLWAEKPQLKYQKNYMQNVINS